MHRPRRVVLVGTRVAEVHQHAVAEQLGHVAFVGGHRGGDSLVVAAQGLAQVLGVEACRQRRRADEVAEHDGQLAALGIRRLCSVVPDTVGMVGVRCSARR